MTASLSLKIFRQHALFSANAWKNQRQWITPEWRADE